MRLHDKGDRHRRRPWHRRRDHPALRRGRRARRDRRRQRGRGATDRGRDRSCGRPGIRLRLRRHPAGGPRPADADRGRAGGRLDILVNNAGVFDMGPLLEISRERWDRLFEVNAKGLFFTLQAAARQMIEQGHGKIINLASQAGRFGVAMVLPYCATKAAVISITQSAALELIEHGINVNAAAPGVVDTEMWTLVDQLYARYQHLPVGEKKRQVEGRRPLRPHGRAGRPRRRRGVPGLRGCRLRGRPDPERGRR